MRMESCDVPHDELALYAFLCPVFLLPVQFVVLRETQER